MEINFFEYLINIGLINKESFSNFVLDYRKKFSKKNFLENMEDLLSNFFENLSKEEKSYMSVNLVKNYLDYLNNKKFDKLKKIYQILKEKLFFQKLKYFFYLKISSFRKKEKIKTVANYQKINKSIPKMNNRIKRNRNTPNELDNFVTMKINTSRKRGTINIDKSSKNKIKNISSSQNDSTTKKYDSTKESINPSKKNNKKNINEIPSSSTLKEQQELKECTFSPKINTYTKIKKNTQKKEIKENKSNTKRLFEVFNKLHNDNLIYQNKIKYNQEKYEKRFKEENTFHPKINNNNSFSKKLNKSNKTFDERQQIYLEKKEKNTEKMKQELDDNCSKLCSFIPEVNTIINTFNKSKIIKNESNTELKNSDIIIDYYSSRTGETLSSKNKSPFLRLYEESKNRNIRKKNREKEYKNRLNEMANISCKKEINNVDYEKLKELYLYDKKNDIIRKTRQKVENEEGTTFKPDIYFNKSSKNIKSGFYERNEKFIKDKQNFIEYSMKERDKLFNNNAFKDNINLDNFSKEEKNEIINNIVKRLAYECG
jgi:hypothetical protein